ncbi:MAG: recombinase family protein [Bacteroidetes bacterium]|nr:recombinase family protein [Bacteroidota bacterium]
MVSKRIRNCKGNCDKDYRNENTCRSAGLAELLTAASRNEFQKVIVTEISRIGRDARDIRNAIDQLHRKKIAVVFKNQAVWNLLMNPEMKVSLLTS